jgi:hypothetical protein
MIPSFEDEMQKVISKWESNLFLISKQILSLWEKKDTMNDLEAQQKVLQHILSLQQKKNLLEDMITDVKAIL